MFSALLSPNFMPSFGKIVGAVFEICRDARTYVRTDARTDGRTHGRRLSYSSPVQKPATNK